MLINNVQSQPQFKKGFRELSGKWVPMSSESEAAYLDKFIELTQFSCRSKSKDQTVFVHHNEYIKITQNHAEKSLIVEGYEGYKDKPSRLKFEPELPDKITDLREDKALLKGAYAQWLKILEGLQPPTAPRATSTYVHGNYTKH